MDEITGYVVNPTFLNSIALQGVFKPVGGCSGPNQWISKLKNSSKEKCMTKICMRMFTLVVGKLYLGWEQERKYWKKFLNKVL